MAGSEYLKAHCVTCVFAGPLLSVFDQCRSDAFVAVFSVGDEHAELSDSITHEVDGYRPNERAVALGQDQRLSAKKALDLGRDWSECPFASTCPIQRRSRLR